MSELQKLYQPITPLFEPNQKEWDSNENVTNKLYQNEIIKQKNTEDRGKTLLHQKNISEIVFNARIVFFKTLEMILINENPIPFILSTEDNQLSICIIVITIGILLLLVSNILN
jgi:hypothetical protein